jgi:hypothetical protein
LEEVEGHETRLVGALMPPLNRTFDTYTRDDAPPWTGTWVRTWLTERGVPLVDVPRELREVDVASVRLDQCCHYNAQGHELLAELFEEMIREQLPELPDDQR